MNAADGPPSAWRRMAVGGSPGERTSTATPPPAIGAAEAAAAAAILPAVTVSMIACARMNECAARSWNCIVTVS
jgi:hypothetical protein